MKRQDWETCNMVAQPVAVVQPVAIPIHDQATRFAGKRGDKQDGKGNGFGVGNPGDPCPTLTKGDKHAVAQPVAFHPTQDPISSTDVRHAIGANENATAAVAFRDTADCLTSAYGTKWNGNASADNGSLFAAQAMQVRRLTPEECEALQGFPRGYTAIPWRGKPADQCPDGPRYKALGNSWAVPVVRWIGERINKVEAWTS